METSDLSTLSKRLRVWVLPSWFPTRHQPANGDFIQRLTQLLAQDVDVRVFAAWRDPEVDSDSCQVRCIAENPLAKEYTYTLRRHRGPLGYLLDRRKEWRYFLERVEQERQAGFEADLILGHVGFPKGWLFLKAKRHLNRPLILCEHWSAYERYDSLPSWIRSALWRVTRHADAVVAVSESLKQLMRQAIGRSDIQVIPNPVIMTSNARSSPKHPIPTWIHISNFMTPVKNIYSMIEGVRQARDLGARFRLVLLGDEPDALLEEAIREQDLSEIVSIVPPCSHDQALDHLRHSDALLHFSLCETFSIVVAEALMMGKPVLCSRCGGVCSMIDETLGRSVAVDDREALAKALVEMTPQLDRYDSAAISRFAQTRFAPTTVRQAWHQVMTQVRIESQQSQTD